MLTQETKWGAVTVKRNFELDADGKWTKVVTSRIPFNPDKILESYVTELGFLSPMMDQGSFAYFKKASILLVREITEVPFQIPMIMDLDTVSAPPKAVFMPAFHSLSTGIKMDPPFVYTPPISQKLWFILSIPSGASGDEVTPFLVAQHVGTGALYHPILPNIYNNCKICLGGVSADILRYNPAKGLGYMMNNALAAWSKSEWNADLLNSGGSRTDEWLKFDEKTRKHIVPDAMKYPWTSFAGPQVSPSPLITEALGAYYNKVIKGGM